jgi:hypothetical protein
MNPYKWLWTRIGGRPWTYIIRDFYHRYEWFWIAGLIYGGAWAGCRWGLDTILKALAIFTLGYVTGHLFWGTKYVEDEKGDLCLM